ncbi:unnamed protein product [marine sediment metagenome]|uniref:Uncharacterized protein n=1 Tax=marine sediment metagenome TaxID=412755 RepID=X0SG15_9ZZZZ
MKKYIILIALFVLSVSVYSQESNYYKYRCPNGCERAAFNKLHELQMIGLPDLIIFECGVCSMEFSEQDLLYAFKMHEDSVKYSQENEFIGMAEGKFKGHLDTKEIQQIKYRCPNGCEGAEFTYVYDVLFAGEKSKVYTCSKCHWAMGERYLLATAKAYRDSVANAKRYADITDSYYPGNPEYTWDGEKWVRKDAYIYKGKKLNAPFPNLYRRIDSLEKRIAELEDIIKKSFISPLPRLGGPHYIILDGEKIELRDIFKEK